MKNKKLITSVFLLSMVITSCSTKSEFPTSPSKWRVEEIKINKNSNQTDLYFVRPIEKKDLNMKFTWFVDSSGRFNVGDTISFQSLKN